MFLFLMAAAVQAQDPQTGAPVPTEGESASAQGIDVTAIKFREGLRVAVAELDIAGAPDDDLQVQYAKTVAYDLEFSDLFQPLRNTAQMASQHRKDREMRAIDYGAWQALEAEVLIKAEFEDSGRGGKIRFYAHDVYDQVSLAALEYPIQYDSRDRKVREVRRAVHNFVDKLVQKYDKSGLPGCAHSYIAFVNMQRRADAAGNQKLVREIFIMDYDGYNIRQITQDRDQAISPAWSPEGRRLAYGSYRQGPLDLYLYDLDTGRIRVLAAFPGSNSAPAWSPDGGSLAVALSRDGNTELYRITAQGTGPMRLTNSRSIETSPCWAPDGRALYYISDAYGSPQIMGMPSGGGKSWRLTSSGQNDDPDINPQGDKIVFTSNQGGGGFSIWIMDVDGNNQMNLTRDLRGNCEHPSWAPDGRHIVFAHDGNIMVMDADGSDKRTLTSQSRLPGKNESPAWGP
jgi:TolB protein